VTTSRCTLVTGAGQGIGAAVAEGAALRGDRVVVADVDLELAERVAAGLSGRGLDATAGHVDVTDSGSVASLVATAGDRIGPISVLVNAAGGFRPAAAVEEISDEIWHQAIALNLFGTFLCCRAVAPGMRRLGWGRIVNVASEAGRMPIRAGNAHYAAAKAGVIGLSRSLARELGPFGVTVNAVAPGTTLTDRVRRLWSPAEVDEIVGLTPVPRLAEIEEQVAPILFLASAEASYINGATLDVNGGRIMM
jgi:3-oxoacyl-[acyl-carrier protein] reductase